MSATYGWIRFKPTPPMEGVFDLNLADLLLHHLTNDTDRYDLTGIEMDKSELMWLRGVVDTANMLGEDSLRDDAEELVKAILKHGTIMLKVEP